MLIDKRRYIRFEVPLDVILPSTGNGGGHSTGVIKNFSREGCCIESNNLDSQLDETMEFRIRLPKKDLYTYVVGDVIWKQPLNNRCLTGIKFREIDKEAKIDILDFAYDTWIEKMKG
ncbi:MAG: PilZ domain-containing protein [Nitrospirae bacterium]|nr:PilZ domain-containing protein [Nitrospirota bacterium]